MGVAIGQHDPAHGIPLGRREVQRASEPSRITEERPTTAESPFLRRPDMLARLEALLDAHDAEQAAPMWPSVNHFPVLVDKHGEQPYEDGDEYIYWPN